MSAGQPGKQTVEEYLARERGSEVRHELRDGEVLTMPAVSWAHGRIGWNISGVLYPQLENQESEGFTGMRVHVPATDHYTYPDVIVACEPQFEDADLDTLLNPSLIVEILSPATEDRDRGNLSQYRSIPSLKDILLVAQDKVHVEHFARQGNGSWRLTELDDLDGVLELPAIGASLALSDVYDRVPGL